MKKIIACLFILATSQALFAQGTRLLRQPDISDNKIVFAYANDLWIVDKAGGHATRLTSFPGLEINPRFLS
jgi:tricorn protease